MIFKDNYGQVIDREHDCISQDPVIITITDTCPCVKPDNQYSNKRWCCGDMNHFDLGVWAFKQMADPGKGVIGIKYRPVSCPANQSATAGSSSSSSSHDVGSSLSSGGESSKVSEMGGHP
ncbi:hypothetical protein CEUSTIGMA_g11602.t1 [Chlamydomonas eustigma]|uniref:Expansin-like EG45 domain-containing protein n=1 Tax=Chlamydomonas eustigma TaxID=1157962 RepID=A0A250XMM7_9CHLO|nr:hypothetical protein CEUSTIGMA_g11602.t1 [Chlamydomonas eustigma]|eukprot:GAX84179.1 hypothetical protein CEUSTIGMA_g11602.t1 [Chlamydomonas eustigma]